MKLVILSFGLGLVGILFMIFGGLAWGQDKKVYQVPVGCDDPGLFSYLYESENGVILRQRGAEVFGRGACMRRPQGVVSGCVYERDVTYAAIENSWHIMKMQTKLGRTIYALLMAESFLTGEVLAWSDGDCC